MTELTARPRLNLHFPLLAGFSQPLAGEFAARRDLLERLALPTGYGVEIAILIDALRDAGLDTLAECHLGAGRTATNPCAPSARWHSPSSRRSNSGSAGCEASPAGIT